MAAENHKAKRLVRLEFDDSAETIAGVAPHSRFGDAPRFSNHLPRVLTVVLKDLSNVTGRRSQRNDVPDAAKGTLVPIAQRTLADANLVDRGTVGTSNISQ